MKTIFFLLQKEFLQIFRNRAMLPIIFVVPVIQLIVLVHAATFEIKNIRLGLIDNDLTKTSSELVGKFQGSPFFNLISSGFSYKSAEEEILRGEADVLFIIPAGFEKKLLKEGDSGVEFMINAINGSAAGLTNGYVNAIINDFNKSLITKLTGKVLQSKINIEYSHWYNPELNYKNFTVPGILVILITIIGFLLSGMNVVREKEIGTIEQINVTPIKKYHFILGKLIPFYLLALLELSIGLVIGKIFFNIPIVGSLWLVYLVASVYLLAILGMGLFVSTMVETQQQSMLISYFFVIIFTLMSGLFTSVESMPEWGKRINWFNPIAYMMKMMRMILLKGSDIFDIKKELLCLTVIAISMILLAVLRYRKRA